MDFNKEPDWESISTDSLKDSLKALDLEYFRITNILEDKIQQVHSAKCKYQVEMQSYEDIKHIKLSASETKVKEEQEFLKLKAELQKTLKDNKEMHNEQIQEMKSRLDDLTKKIHNKESNKKAIQKKREELKEQKEKEQQEVEKMQNLIASKQLIITDKKYIVTEQLEKQKSIEEEIESIKETLEELQSNLKQKTETLEALNGQIKSTQEEISLLTNETKEECKIDHQTKGNSMFAEVHDRNQQLEERIKVAKARIEEMKVEFRQNSQDLKGIKDLKNKFTYEWQLYHNPNSNHKFIMQELYEEQFEEAIGIIIDLMEKIQQAQENLETSVDQPPICDPNFFKFQKRILDSSDEAVVLSQNYQTKAQELKEMTQKYFEMKYSSVLGKFDEVDQLQEDFINNLNL